MRPIWTSASAGAAREEHAAGEELERATEAVGKADAARDAAEAAQREKEKNS